MDKNKHKRVERPKYKNSLKSVSSKVLKGVLSTSLLKSQGKQIGL